MNISQNGIDLIKKFEGCSLSAYKCPSGVWTIGFGHTGADVSGVSRITEDEAEKLFKQDLIIHCNNVSRLVTVPLTQNQFDALVSFEFNLGYGNLSKSTLLKLLNAGKYIDAANQFDKWVCSGKKKLAGLIKRREAEKALFLK